MIVCFKCGNAAESDIVEWTEIEPGLETKVCAVCTQKKKKVKHENTMGMESTGSEASRLYIDLAPGVAL